MPISPPYNQFDRLNVTINDTIDELIRAEIKSVRLLINPDFQTNGHMSIFSKDVISTAGKAEGRAACLREIQKIAKEHISDKAGEVSRLSFFRRKKVQSIAIETFCLIMFDIKNIDDECSKVTHPDLIDEYKQSYKSGWFSVKMNFAKIFARMVKSQHIKKKSPSFLCKAMADSTIIDSIQVETDLNNLIKLVTEECLKN